MPHLDRVLDDAELEARRAMRSRVLRGVARSGYVASALLRGMIGWLALLLAADIDGARPDASGAFGAIAAVPGGVLLLALVAAGDLALLLWLVLRGVLHRDPHPLERWRQRSVYWGRAVVYGVIGVTAARFALGAHEQSSRTERHASSQLLLVPGGAVVLAIIGGVVVVTGVSMAWLGVSRRFVKTVRLPDAPAARRAVLALGIVGYVAQGATIAIVGAFVVVAAFTVDPDRAGGLGGALVTVAGSGGGRVLLVAIGVGWVVAGLYALVRARIARVA